MNIAIIVFYNPSENTSGYKGIIEQCDYTFIVDNSEHKNLVESPYKEKYEYIPLYKNFGIAEAQNIALNRINSKFSEHNDIYIFQFDQDSEIENNYILNMNDSYNHLEELGINVGVLGPLPVNKLEDCNYKVNSFSTSKGISVASTNYENIDCLISSGSLVNKKVFDNVGGFCSELFIDSVDHEWCWRVMHAGYENFMDKSIPLRHFFGEGDVKFLGRSIRCGSPIRYYYSFRNWLLLFRMSHVPIRYKLRMVVLIPVKFVVYVILFGKRVDRFKYILRGIWDGILGRSGAFVR